MCRRAASKVIQVTNSSLPLVRLCCSDKKLCQCVLTCEHRKLQLRVIDGMRPERAGINHPRLKAVSDEVGPNPIATSFGNKANPRKFFITDAAEQYTFTFAVPHFLHESPEHYARADWNGQPHMDHSVRGVSRWADPDDLTVA